MAVDSGQYDEATLARQRMAAALLGGALKPEENVKHWAQGLANLAKAGIGGYMGYQANEEAKQQREQASADVYKTLGLTPPATTAAAESPSVFAKIGSMLSGGSAPSADMPAGPPGDQAVYEPPPEPPPPPTTFRPGITAPATAPPVAPDPSLPRGLRNNNPLNIEAGDFTKGQPGYVGSDGRFARFETADQGVAAANKLLDTYERQYGLNTPAGIIGRWAPKGENNTEAYAAAVAKKLGIGPNDTVTPEMRPRLIAAMSEVENGKPAAVPQIAMALTTPAGNAALPPGATPTQGALPTAAPTASSGILADVPQDKKLQIAQMLTSRNPTVKAMGAAMVQQLTKPETTDEIKEYNLYTKQVAAKGEKPLSFFDYKSGLKKAGAVNVTTNIEKPELAFDTEAGKLQAKRFDELAADGQTAKQMVSDIQTLTDLGKNIGTGKTAEFKAAIGPYAESLGLKIDGLSDIQAYEAVVNRLAPNLRVKGSGAQSDMELKNFLKSLPSLGNTPEGNEIASTVLTGLQENKIRAAEIGSKALTKEISRSEAEKQLRELPDPMTRYREYMKANRGAPTAAGDKTAAPDRAAIEAEMRKRGLLK